MGYQIFCDLAQGRPFASTASCLILFLLSVAGFVQAPLAQALELRDHKLVFEKVLVSLFIMLIVRVCGSLVHVHVAIKV